MILFYNFQHGAIAFGVLVLFLLIASRIRKGASGFLAAGATATRNRLADLRAPLQNEAKTREPFPTALKSYAGRAKSKAARAASLTL